MQIKNQQPNAPTPRRIFPLTPEMVRRLFADDASRQRKADQNGQKQAA
jgi:hypothetical protein